MRIGFDTIQDNIDLKPVVLNVIVVGCFDTIQDNIDLKLITVTPISTICFDTIQDNIDLKPQILNLWVILYRERALS